MLDPMLSIRRFCCSIYFPTFYPRNLGPKTHPKKTSPMIFHGVSFAVFFLRLFQDLRMWREYAEVRWPFLGLMIWWEFDGNSTLDVSLYRCFFWKPCLFWKWYHRFNHVHYYSDLDISSYVQALPNISKILFSTFIIFHCPLLVHTHTFVYMRPLLSNSFLWTLDSSPSWKVPVWYSTLGMCVLLISMESFWFFGCKQPQPQLSVRKNWAPIILFNGNVWVHVNLYQNHPLVMFVFVLAVFRRNLAPIDPTYVISKEF